MLLPARIRRVSLKRRAGAAGSKVTQNTYDGSEYWGTITIKNAGSSAVTGFDVSFSIPSGDHCTNDAVPSSATLSPLSGSGSSADDDVEPVHLHLGHHHVEEWGIADVQLFHRLDELQLRDGCRRQGDELRWEQLGLRLLFWLELRFSSSGSGSSSGGGTESCGCNGQAGCAVWPNVYVSWYGFNDNSCTVGEPARLQRHRLSRAGAGVRRVRNAVSQRGEHQAHRGDRRDRHVRRPDHRGVVRGHGSRGPDVLESAAQVRVVRWSHALARGR